MKILWLSHLVPYPPKGGVLQRSFHLLRELAQGNEVDLLAFAQKSLIDDHFESFEKGKAEAALKLGSFCERVAVVDIPADSRVGGTYRLALASLVSRYPYTINWLQSGKFEETLKSWLASKPYDLIHFDTISLAPYKNCCPDVTAVLDHHNVESHLLLRRSGKTRNPLMAAYLKLEGKRLESYERNVCGQFDLNVTCSDLDSQRLTRISEGLDVRAVPNGVDIDYFAPDISEPDFSRLIFVGSLNWFPNTEAARFIAEQLWPRVSRAMPEAKCDIVGGRAPAFLSDLASRDPRFQVCGFVDDVRPYLARAGIFVCPIKDGGGTKLKILDALAMGKVIVADPIACEGIDVQDGKTVIFASTANEYVEVISKLQSDRSRCKEIGYNARRLAVEKYSYKGIGFSFREMYSDLVSRSNKPGAVVHG